MIDNFKDLGLNYELVKAVTELGFTKPTQVQEIVIPIQMNTESDIVCLAQTGTGKTAAFGLPMIQSLDLNSPQTQVVILCPTRELCRQISDDLNKYARYSKGFQLVSVYGGSGIETQIRALRKGANVIVATPGRMVDLLERKVANISGAQRVILDEADEMLNMGFKEELDTILSYCPTNRRTFLFSATLPTEVEGIARKYMYKPEIVTVGKRNQGADNVKHYYYVVQAKDRYLALKRIVDYNPHIYGIVFCRTRQETQEIADSLIRDGYNAEALHGELSQTQRDWVMSRFRNKTLSLLVATDVAARGIDVNDLTHVINYNLPDEPEQYTHRSGRTGRADKTGVSIAIINVKEKSKITRIEKIIGKPFAQAKIPTGKEVCSKQLFNLIDQIENTEVKEEINEYMSVVENKWSYLSKEEIIQRVLSIEFNRFLEYYKHTPDLNVPEAGATGRDGRSSKNGKQDAPAEKGFTWIELNIGTRKGITPRQIIRLMTACGVGKKGIGRIELYKEYTRLEISSSVSSDVAKQLNGSSYRGKRLTAKAF